MAYTLETTLGTLMDEPRAKAVLDKYAPGLATNPMVGMVKGMSLNTLVSMPQAKQLGLTKEKAQAALDEINKLVK